MRDADGKRKLNQNRPEEDRASVIRALAASEDPADRRWRRRCADEVRSEAA